MTLYMYLFNIEVAGFGKSQCWLSDHSMKISLQY